jgi:hypothetical protein
MPRLIVPRSHPSIGVPHEHKALAMTDDPVGGLLDTSWYAEGGVQRKDER